MSTLESVEAAIEAVRELAREEMNNQSLVHEIRAQYAQAYASATIAQAIEHLAKVLEKTKKVAS